MIRFETPQNMIRRIQRDTCYKCGESREATRPCAKCKLVWYCSAECQRSDYDEHTRTCREHNDIEKRFVTYANPPGTCGNCLLRRQSARRLHAGNHEIDLCEQCKDVDKDLAACYFPCGFCGQADTRLMRFDIRWFLWTLPLCDVCRDIFEYDLDKERRNVEGPPGFAEIHEFAWEVAHAPRPVCVKVCTLYAKCRNSAPNVDDLTREIGQYVMTLPADGPASRAWAKYMDAMGRKSIVDIPNTDK